MKKNFAGWMAIGTPLLLGVGLLGAHHIAYVGQAAMACARAADFNLCSFASFVLRGHVFGSGNMQALRAGIGISGPYGLGTGLIIIHYGSRWGFLTRS